MKTFKLPRQSQYPKTVQFGIEVYKLKFKKGLDCYGYTDSGTKTITIKDGLSPRMTLATYVHELLHVIEFEHPLKLKHKTIYKLEAAIVELLLDNFL